MINMFSQKIEFQIYHWHDRWSQTQNKETRWFLLALNVLAWIWMNYNFGNFKWKKPHKIILMDQLFWSPTLLALMRSLFCVISLIQGHNSMKICLLTVWLTENCYKDEICLDSVIMSLRWTYTIFKGEKEKPVFHGLWL